MGRRLGGEDRRLATGGPGSSPGVPSWPVTSNRTVLRNMLKIRDRRLRWWDQLRPTQRWYFSELVVLDNERKLIRRKLKDLGRENV